MAFKKKKIALQSKNIIALNRYIDINELVYERRLMMKVDKVSKTAVSSLNMSEMEIFLRLTQAPNTSMKISRNKGATKKASRKIVHDKVFF